MKWLRLVRAELRKLGTTKMPWVFVAVLVVISAITATAVLIGTDADGSKAFIATRQDQRSLLAFGANAMMGAGLFGAIAVAREYAHGTVVPMFLTSPRRGRAMSAQLVALFVVGGLLGVVGAALTIVAGAVSIVMIDRAFLLTAGDVIRIVAASSLAAAFGAILGGGAGALVRNTGGAVTVAVLLLIIAPPLVVQLATDAATWVPSTVVNVVSGVGTETSLAAALVALALWGLVPAAIGVGAVQRRDVI